MGQSETSGWSDEKRAAVERGLAQARRGELTDGPDVGQSEASMIAHGGYRASAYRRVMYVSNQIVQECRDWSRPVRFKFVENEDGSVEMWMQNAEAPDA